MISANKKKLNKNDLRVLLDERVLLYNQPSFIPSDPISIPHLFTRRQDIEIAGLFAAVLAWGNRTTIIGKSKELLQRMDMAPYDFCLNHRAADLKRLLEFKHRTFNDTDLLYFIAFLHHHYHQHISLETAFIAPEDAYPEISHPAEKRLTHFHRYFFSLEDAPERTRKHIATPERGSACKRLNMFLRWMVRKDKAGVDFGIWQQIPASELICPLDLHVARVARKLGILKRKNNDWIAALELTDALKKLNPVDPVQYDFALFSLGVIEKY
jgi:uncharacterized protein (TIGR02757 family)